ncbi:MAG: sigma 54-interacting transcriptional regulator [Desulfomonilaceae bacterium]
MSPRKRILIVDDEEQNRELLEAVLESLGYGSELADSGTTALAKLNAGIDLVLLDIMMPGMDGFEVARKIRNHPEFRDIPIIMVTVLGGKKDRLEAVKAGANDFITKPVDKLELQVRVTSLLRMKEAQDAIKRHKAELEIEIERRTAELRESEERFRYIFEAGQDCMFVKDRDRRYSHVNPAMVAILEKNHVEIIGRTDEELFAAEWAARMKTLDERVLQGQPAESELNLLCGERPITFNVVRFPMRDASGKIIGLCGIARDVTERRARESEMRIRSSQPGSNIMQTTLELVRRAAKTDSLVLFTGESGSGKDYLAEYLHRYSGRVSGPYFTVNCAAIAPNVAESELFGHESGSFTGARGRKRGLLELAEGGTLLLNEVGELSSELQAKLLMFMDTQTFTRVGGESNIKVNTRIVAATNRDLEKDVESGRFRRDLFFRLNVFHVIVPPLRERMEDLPVLIDAILPALAQKIGLHEAPAIDSDAMDALRNYSWPGNVRELRNTLERALILCDKKYITARDLGMHSDGEPSSGRKGDISLTLRLGRDDSLHDILTETKRYLVMESLKRSGGSIKKAAQFLGITRDSLTHHMRSLGIRK